MESNVSGLNEPNQKRQSRQSRTQARSDLWPAATADAPEREREYWHARKRNHV